MLRMTVLATHKRKPIKSDKFLKKKKVYQTKKKNMILTQVFLNFGVKSNDLCNEWREKFFFF